MARSGPGEPRPPRSGRRKRKGPGLDQRHGPGDAPERVGGIIRGLLGDGRLRRGSALGRLVLAWPQVVGPDLALVTEPRALDRGGLLVAASSSAWGSQVRFLAEEVRRRANAALGGEEVRSVRVIVASGPRDRLRRNGSESPEGPHGTRGGGPPR